jgi:hypothetical protein
MQEMSKYSSQVLDFPMKGRDWKPMGKGTASGGIVRVARILGQLESRPDARG